MNVLPLFTPPSHPDAWHQVTAPGGYEGWYFDAEDVTGRLRIVASLHEGFAFHPGYLRRYATYLRQPQRRTPPVPGEYPVACFAVYEDEKIVSQFTSQFPASAFAAAVDGTEVRIGPNRASRDAEGVIRLQLRGTPWKRTWRGPRLLAGEELVADLLFRPSTPGGAMERTNRSLRLSGADRGWVIADPLCDVMGTIDAGLAGHGRGTVGRRMTLTGRGYHDHYYGTAPIGAGQRRWIRGRVIADDRAYAFHLALARDARPPNEIRLIKADAAGQSEVPVAAAAVDWSRHTAMGLAYPREIYLSPYLRLTSPRVVHSTMSFVVLVYEAQLEGGKRTTAFCEVAYLHRLLCPILGRLIEMSIDKNACVISSSDTPVQSLGRGYRAGH